MFVYTSKGGAGVGLDSIISKIVDTALLTDVVSIYHSI